MHRRCDGVAIGLDQLSQDRDGDPLGNVVAAYEATVPERGSLSLSGVIDGDADAALMASDTLELRPTKLAITEHRPR